MARGQHLCHIQRSFLVQTQSLVLEDFFPSVLKYLNSAQLDESSVSVLGLYMIFEAYSTASRQWIGLLLAAYSAFVAWAYISASNTTFQKDILRPVYSASLVQRYNLSHGSSQPFQEFFSFPFLLGWDVHRGAFHGDSSGMSCYSWMRHWLVLGIPKVKRHLALVLSEPASRNGRVGEEGYELSRSKAGFGSVPWDTPMLFGVSGPCIFQTTTHENHNDFGGI